MPELGEDEVNSAPSSEVTAQTISTSNSVTEEESSSGSCHDNFTFTSSKCIEEFSEGHHSTEAEEPAFGDDRLDLVPRPVPSLLSMLATRSVVLVKEDENNTKGHTQTIFNIWNLFRYATCLDWFLMIVGSLMAILHGFVLPIALLVLAFITDAFSFHELSRIIANIQYYVPFDYLLSLQTNGAEGRPLELGELTRYEPNPNVANIEFNVQHLTEGMVNCSAAYVYRLPYPFRGQINFTIGELVRSATVPAAVCYDDKSFTDYMNTLIFGLLVVIVVATGLGAIQMLIFHLTSERQMRKMRLYYFQSILSQERKWHDLQTQGDLGIHLSEDIEKVHNGVGINLSLLIQYLSTFVAGLLGSFYLNWEITLILLATTPFIVAPSGVFNQLVATFGSAEQKHYATAGNIAEEILSAIRTVVAFGGEHKEVDRYEYHLNAAKKVGTRRGIAGGLSLCTVYFVLFSSFGIAFWYGAHIVTQQKETGGIIVAVFFSVSIGAFYLGESSTNIGNLLVAAVAAIPILETIDRKSEIDPISEEGEEPERFNGGVDFKAVTFVYPSRPNVPVINEFNLSIKPGQVVAIIGPSGGGKSTTVKLLQRFYDPAAGKVLFDKKDIKSLSVKWLRSLIGTVSQEPVLFNTTIRNNILFGNKDASMPDVIQAAKAANAHHFIMSLPLGYNTVVGEQGGQLSGGQKQRIAIARALVRNPKILLLDEATSALDTENEAILLETIKNVAGEMTVIVITHRLPLVKCADIVVSVEGGKVTWKGTPAELYAMKNINVDKDDDPTLAFPAGKLQPQVFKKGQTLSMRRQNASLRRGNFKEQESYGEFSIFKKILTLNRKEWWIISLGVLAAIISGAGFPIFAVMFGGVFEVFIKPSRDVFSHIHPWAGGFILLGAGIGAAIFVKTLCFSISGESLTRRVRYLTFKAMLRQEIGWFDNDQNTTGILVGTLSDDGRNVQAVAGSRLGWFVEGAMAIILAHTVSFRYNWILTIVLSMVVPLYLLSGWLNTRASVSFARIRRQALQEATETAVESVENIETVSSLGLEERMYRDYEQKIKKPTRRALALTPLSGLSQTVLLVGYIIAFRFGAYQVTLDEDHIFYSRFIDVLIVFAALAFTSTAIGLSGSLGPDYALAKVSAKRILKILERKPTPDGYSQEGAKLDNIKGELSFNNLFFRYPNRPEVKVLQDIDIIVKPGQTLALVGVSGSGKTTLFSLIERFYDPVSGTVALDGVGYQYLNIRWLRSQIGVVSQEPVLFDLSIAENIRYGANGREVSDLEIEEAAKAANIHDFITTLPSGYATNVGSRGAQLSGGQKQRVAIARALIHNPTILLLDEATSALDDVSESIVQAALDKAMKGRTSVMISHRMSTIVNADVIVVVNGGKVTEMGSHEELMAKEGDYFRMVHMQTI